MNRPALTVDYIARLFPCTCGCARESHLVTAGKDKRRGGCGRYRKCPGYRSSFAATGRAA